MMEMKMLMIGHLLLWTFNRKLMELNKGLKNIFSEFEGSNVMKLFLEY